MTGPCTLGWQVDAASSVVLCSRLRTGLGFLRLGLRLVHRQSRIWTQCGRVRGSLSDCIQFPGQAIALSPEQG
ncbi:Dna polymerase Delta Catalytic Subunit [Manis pentadactyla]|nr:Dna polymerase Delta Catalytic Subunit [Manis pentadactyla]